MSTKYFQRFEKLYYKFGDETSYNIMQNLTQYVDLIDQIKPTVAFYEDYTIKSGDRPDTLSFQLYDDINYYWTFYLLNDHLRESGWPLKNEEVLSRAKEFYPHRVVTSTTDLATESGNPPRSFSVGRQVIGQTSGTVGTIIKRNLDLGQLIIDTDTAFTSEDVDFELTVNSNGASSITLTNSLQKFAQTDLWVLQKTDNDNPSADAVALSGYQITLDNIDTVAELRNIPFEVGNYTYTLTTKVRTFNSTDSTFLQGENIYFIDQTSGLTVFADVHKETAQYNAVHHYEDADGEWVDIDPFTQTIGSSLIPVTNLTRLENKNDDLKQIKVLKPSAVESVVKEFYRLMNER